MPTKPAMRKPQEDEKLPPKAKQIFEDFLNLYKTIDSFSGCELRTSSNWFVPGLNMMMK